MSRQDTDRNLQLENGKGFPGKFRSSSASRGEGFAAAVAAALHEEFGHTGSAIKVVASITHANERAVRNWFEAKNAPIGVHLVDLMQHSDRVLETILLLSGRSQVARDLVLANLQKELRELADRIRVEVLDIDH